MSDPKDDRPETPDVGDGTTDPGDDVAAAPPSSTGPDEDAADAASAVAAETPRGTDDQPGDAGDATAPEASSSPSVPTGDDEPLDDDNSQDDQQDDEPLEAEAPAEPVHLAPGHDEPVTPSPESTHPAHAVFADAGSDSPTSAQTTTESEPSARPVSEADPGPVSGPDAAGEPASAAASSEPSGWRRLGAALRPRASRSQVLAGVLCAALGFALVVQVQQSASDQLSSARQEDLVRLLDEVTDRAQQLGDEVSGLEATRDELESGSGQARSALELAEQRAESEGILSGRLPAQGPGVRITIQDPEGALKASQMFNVLEELRNAGAEVVELNGVRLVTSTWFEDERTAIVVDGTALSSPYEWTVIGDPETLDRALEIPGGALATVRTAGAEASTAREDEVEITAVTPPQEPEYAQPERQDD
ncbi:DUF881 domain-containing protein [Isoptericola sp. NPDC019482]|uniref:DUF881 domain-containing protein n=1 Tax=Isoptericola sp. NPDC019482 TaxID=3154688 RepID=UPI00346B82E8